MIFFEENDFGRPYKVWLFINIYWYINPGYDKHAHVIAHSASNITSIQITPSMRTFIATGCSEKCPFKGLGLFTLDLRVSNLQKQGYCDSNYTIY